MAGYNNYFPQSTIGYPYNLNNFSNSNGQIATQPNTINWVQGEAGAKSVLVQPGQKVLLMDSESNIFYVKSSDPSGMPLPLRTFEYKEVNKEPSETNSNQSEKDFITREEFERALSELKPKEKQEEKKQNEFLI